MQGLTPKQIAKACGGTLYGGDNLPEAEISSVTTDSRKVEKDCLFIPLVGKRADGHDFISQVMRDGAMLALSQNKLNESFPYIYVESTAQALKDLAEYYLEVLDIPVVGITGSVGKTSTKEMIAAVLSQKFRVLKTEGNFNNEIGLPLTVFRLRSEHQIAVLEMGISEFGEMSRLGKVAKPDVMVYTNIGVCHLENLKTRDGILQAKTEVFEEMPPGGTVILNGDDDKLSSIREAKGKKLLFYGIHPELSPAPFLASAEKIETSGLTGTDFVLTTDNQRVPVHIPLPGEHMVSNALAAAAVGLHFGITPEEIARGIGNAASVSGRMNILETGKYTVIDDCYNANPVSMKASLKLLADAKLPYVKTSEEIKESGNISDVTHDPDQQDVPESKDGPGKQGVPESKNDPDKQDVPESKDDPDKQDVPESKDDPGKQDVPESKDGSGRRVAILGDMFELGAEERKLHRQVGAFAAECGLDVLIFVGTLSREMAEAAEARKAVTTEIYYYETKKECLEELDQLLREGDTVLVKASHGMGFAEIVDRLSSS